MNNITAKVTTLSLVSDKALISIFFFGFASGLPFLLILSTLSLWLTEVGASKTQIGLFAWVTISYTLKFLWSPLVDHIKIPVLCRIFGLRRGWILTSQVFLAVAIFVLASSNPETNLMLAAVAALLVGLFSATQDLVIEAYRIEILDKKQLGIGSSISVLGYRLGMLCSGAGAIYLAEYFSSWQIAYKFMACAMSICMVATMLAEEPQIYRNNLNRITKNNWFANIVIKPVSSFIRMRRWWVIIPFIVSFKLADTVLNAMSMPFLIDIGFNKLEIANVAKTFGITFMILGGIMGGILLHKKSLRKILFICTILQLIACLLFYQQALLGNNLVFLFLTMGVENFTCGMSQVALICCLSKLCSLPHTAMHYAILSSFASFVRISLSTVAGIIADHSAWPVFYLGVAATCILTFVILFFNGESYDNKV
jgi:MFS transporter, PAT family, beta-lactamase induction signal transducer AmpG